MLARQNRIDTANVPAPTCNNQLIISTKRYSKKFWCARARQIGINITLDMIV